MATLTVQNISLAGITPSYAGAAEAGDEFLNTGDTFFQIKNGGSEATVTIETPAKIEGIDIAEIAVVVPATTGDKMIGPFDSSIFNQTTGRVAVTYSSETSITVGAFKL